MRRPALAAFVAVLTLLLSGGPAHAGDDIGLSRDGRHWSPTMTEPLFDPAAVWVPGDSHTAAFYVRNQGPSAGDLRVELHSDDPDQLVGGGDVRIEARTTGGRWFLVEETGPARRIADSLVPARSQTRLEVRATFDTRSGNQTQSDRAGLTFVVRLSGDTPPASSAGSPAAGDHHDGSRPLPRTGADGLGWLLIIAATSTGCGMALRRAGRQR